MRWYLRGRIGKHIGWVYLGPFGRGPQNTLRNVQPRRTYPRGLQVFALLFCAASVTLLCAVLLFVR